MKITVFCIIVATLAAFLFLVTDISKKNKTTDNVNTEIVVVDNTFAKVSNLKNTVESLDRKAIIESIKGKYPFLEEVYALVAELNDRGAKVVISQHPGRAQKLGIDPAIYAWRHLIENFFCRLKEFKRIAMRACKTDRSFEAMIYLAAAVIHSR